MGISAQFRSGPETDTSEGDFWSGDRFYDRAGDVISITQWAQLRSTYEYTVIGDWTDGNGSRVRTVWTGIDINYGYADTLMFETHCIVGDTANYYLHATDTVARESHEDCVRGVHRNSDVPAKSLETGTPVVLPLQFFDRQGNSITLDRWARLRRDPNYCVIDQWRGEGGAHVEVLWTGLDLLSGFHARPQVFSLCISAFENCPQSDCS